MSFDRPRLGGEPPAQPLRIRAVGRNREGITAPSRPRTCKGNGDVLPVRCRDVAYGIGTTDFLQLGAGKDTIAFARGRAREREGDLCLIHLLPAEGVTARDRGGVC